MGWMEFTLGMATLILGTGWLFTYRSHKRKANGEATTAEADGWKAQQDVYQQTIADLEHSCEFIRNDRDLLRKENEELRAENRDLQKKIHSLEDKVEAMSLEIERNSKRIDELLNKK